MDSGSKNRVKLWLRSEKAMGAPSVPVVLRAELPQESAAEGIAEAPPSPEPPAKAAPAAGVGLFGEVAPPKRSGLMPPPSVEPFTAPLLSTSEKSARLISLDNNEVRGCTRCRLCEQRTNTVFGEGDPDAKLMFIGEGPGENEDLQGRPFVGRAGDLLNKMIAGMGLQREQVYIVNVVKCRPPGNRTPVPDEVATCTPYLERQIEIIRPQVIVTLGLPATQYMLQTKTSMGRMRGHWHQWRGIKLMPTWHPAYVLRSYNQQTRGEVWSDLQQVMSELGLPLKKGKSAP